MDKSTDRVIGLQFRRQNENNKFKIKWQIDKSECLKLLKSEEWLN